MVLGGGIRRGSFTSEYGRGKAQSELPSYLKKTKEKMQNG